MEIRKVDDSFAVAPQIQPDDMQKLAEAGFTAVMCNRPDAEEPGQPPIEDLRAAAQAAGLSFYLVPVSGGQFPTDALQEFRRIRQETAGPLLAYCRSGTRSITMETLSNPEDLPADERIARAAVAGYDLSGLRAHLD